MWAKQLSIDAPPPPPSEVIWLCACLRYWSPGSGQWVLVLEICRLLKWVFTTKVFENVGDSRISVWNYHLPSESANTVEGFQEACVGVSFEVAMGNFDSFFFWTSWSVTNSPVARVPLLCVHHILKSSEIYYWTDKQQHGIYLVNRPWGIVVDMF